MTLPFLCQIKKLMTVERDSDSGGVDMDES